MAKVAGAFFNGVFEGNRAAGDRPYNRAMRVVEKVLVL